MTKEEAIDLLDNLIGMVEDNHNSDYDTALKMGIEALEQERSVIKELEKIKQEIQSIIALADSRGEDSKLAYQCQIVINERISELKGE